MKRKFINEKIKQVVGEKQLNIKLKKLDERAVIPSYAHDGDVGMDMTAITCEYDKEHDMYVYGTGIAIESDFNIGDFLFPRSSNRKTDCYLCNSVGIADSAIYRGEIKFCFKSRISTFERANIVALKAFNKAIVDGKTAQEAQTESTNAYNRIIEMTENLEFAPYQVGHKIGQMVMMFHPKVKINVVEELSTSSRGANGFGSTGN